MNTLQAQNNRTEIQKKPESVEDQTIGLNDQITASFALDYNLHKEIQANDEYRREQVLKFFESKFGPIYRDPEKKERVDVERIFIALKDVNTAEIAVHQKYLADGTSLIDALKKEGFDVKDYTKLYDYNFAILLLPLKTTTEATNIQSNIRAKLKNFDVAD